MHLREKGRAAARAIELMHPALARAPQERDFHFCGKPKAVGHPFCDFHLRRGFQPARPRRVVY